VLPRSQSLTRLSSALTVSASPDPYHPGGTCLAQAPGPSELPMFTRHEYRTRAGNEWAARGVGRRWCGKLKPQAAG
jgi:hypothetical protein